VDSLQPSTLAVAVQKWCVYVFAGCRASNSEALLILWRFVQMGYTVSCCVAGCNVTAHPLCARQRGLLLLSESFVVGKVGDGIVLQVVDFLP
jgi:hypothetical protein